MSRARQGLRVESTATSRAFIPPSPSAARAREGERVWRQGNPTPRAPAGRASAAAACPPPRPRPPQTPLPGLSAMMASLSAAAWAVVLAALGSLALASASDDAGLAPPLAAPAPATAAAPPRLAPRANNAVLPRKMLRPGGTEGDGGVRPHRVDEGCAGAEDIAIYQGRGTTLPSGVPAYTVDVMNRCAGGDCAIADIHVRCGWFSSVSLVDPRKFRRLGRDDCLLNDGRPLLAGDTVSFEYSNSFPYKLSVAVATCVDSTSP